MKLIRILSILVAGVALVAWWLMRPLEPSTVEVEEGLAYVIHRADGHSSIEIYEVVRVFGLEDNRKTAQNLTAYLNMSDPDNVYIYTVVLEEVE